ncbi:Pheromone/general odorant binding protein [Cinara cedri]|uniref:Pheromone/general odorant binding protein n=1 Tax=Cinara cedri TaxID=506608 RepID=A0A5E4LXN6_9HEMI|nr:Pheromone/general odorant binding protein [Cinara cedri]
MYVLRAMCLCLAAVVVFGDNSSGSSKSRSNEVLKSCVAETKLSEDALKTLRAKGVPQTQPEKCMVGCLMRKKNVISNGTFSEKGLSQIAHEYFGTNQTIVTQAKSLVQVCANRAQSAGTDECTLAGVVTTCVVEEAQKAGLPTVPGSRSTSKVTTKVRRNV